MKHGTLFFRYTTSKARDSYGWNVVTLYDSFSNKKWRTCGGGYDMIGTVIAEWLHENFLQRIIDACVPYAHEESNSQSGDYGFFERNGRYFLDGGCGQDCMKRIAKKAGIEISLVWDERKRENIAMQWRINDETK